MSTNPSVMDIPPAPSPEAIIALKRRITALEEENVHLTNRVTRTPIKSFVREGRAIRRLVTLTDPVTDLIAEYDRRIMMADDDQDIDSVVSTAEEKRTFRSYKKLVDWCPSVKTIMQVHGEVALACQELKKGADGARGDDANRLKYSVATWLNEQQPAPVPLFHVDDKQRRGFNHNITGQLLCPVDFNWLDAPTRNAIRDYHASYPVTANMWPSFLYYKGQYNPACPSDGLFKGGLLMKAFRCIFTSPASARDGGMDDSNEALPRKKVHTRCNVAGLLKMRSVQPRAIAYVAVQLRFALSSNTFWTIKDDNFDYETFYNNIVDWFELPASEAKAGEIAEVLRWWNRMMFGRRQASALEPQDVANLSVSRSMA